tara:strand:- start:401 stop:1855 length:1455 start_codon:yes stop_codon:yes gene_type:complete
MSISLYTSRIVLDVLGAQDFGLYVVIGGLVASITFFSTSLQSGLQRFLAYSLGKKDYKRYNEVFNVGIVLYIFVVLLIAIFCETVGLWYVNNKLTISSGREEVAVIVFHFSVLSVCASVMRIPYDAGILAQEKMKFFAYLSIFESLLKLIIVNLLLVGDFDKLILYSFLIFTLTIFTNLVFMVYCKLDSRNLYKFSISKNKALYFELFSFTNWRLLEASAQIAQKDGVALLLNNFFGLLVNAANGIAMQISIAVNGLVFSFQQAFMPQITKNYASGDFIALESLSKRAAKFSFLLLTFFAIPLILNMEYVLGIWLVSSPEFAAQFSILILINMLIDSFNGPLWMIILATGRIAFYQIFLASLIFISIICDYFLLKNGYPAITVFYVLLATTFITIFYRLLLLRLYYGILISNFIRDVILKPVLLVLLIFFMINIFSADYDSFTRLTFSLIVTFSIYPILIFLFILDNEEKEMLKKSYFKFFHEN